MKSILFFGIFAVTAHKVLSGTVSDAVPRDIELPVLYYTEYDYTHNDRRLYKHQVGLYFNDKFWCGGSIISKRVIVTAAHCTDQMSYALVLVGLYDKSVLSPETEMISITRKNWIQHPYYRSRPIMNDLAIINLPKTIEFGIFVGPIRVEWNDKRRHENEAVLISGWGKRSDSQSPRPNIILGATVARIAPGHECNVFNVVILKSMICVTGTNPVGICQDDSGGPIVSTRNGRLLGVTSFGAQGCDEFKPRVFTRLSSYAKWIQDNSIDYI